MIPRLTFGDDANIAAWVKMRIPVLATAGRFTAIGVVDSETGTPLAGVIYNSFREGDCNIHLAADDPRWCTRRVISVLLQYPFVQLKQRRLTAISAQRNKHGRKFIERIGFKIEGKIRHAFPKDNAIVYGMLVSECRWIPNGRLIRQG